MKLSKGKNVVKKYELVPENLYNYTISNIKLEKHNALTDVVSITYSLKNRINRNAKDIEYIHTQRYYLSDEEKKYEYTSKLFYEWLDTMERTYGKDNLYIDDEFNETYLIGMTGTLRIKHQVYNNVTYANTISVCPTPIELDTEDVDIEAFLDEI